MQTLRIEKRKVNHEPHYFYLCSDLHIGDPLHDSVKFKSDMDDAVEKDADIFINGDVTSAIIKSDVKRYSKSADKYDYDDTLNRVVEELTDTLFPYRERIKMIGIGNHEVSIMKSHDYDIVRQVIINLNSKKSDKSKVQIVHGGYCGFIRICMHRNHNDHRTYDIFYNHGQGGSASVTRGAIDLTRRQYIRADLIWLGHKHTKISDMLDSELYLDNGLNVCEKEKRGVITGAYLKNFEQYNIEDGYRINYGNERMRTPQAKGGVMLELKFTGRAHELASKIIF